MSLELFYEKIVASNELHARWLNTLSYLENCGARMIAACEHPTQVIEETLKHAAEEFRHAHHLKRQIGKLGLYLPDYSHETILGGYKSWHYLKRLNIFTSRLLKEYGMPLEYAYALVTYAIEVRASALYPQYEGVLRQAGSKITVRAIIVEEEGHLLDMQRAIQNILMGNQLAERVCQYEADLYVAWMQEVLSGSCIHDS